MKGSKRPWNCICSRRFSSASWLRMYRTIVSSSSPTVHTQYPFAQKCKPLKFRFCPRHSLRIRMADLPYRKPIVLATTDGMSVCDDKIGMPRMPRSLTGTAFARDNPGLKRCAELGP